MLRKIIKKLQQILEQFGLSQAIYSRGVFYYRKQEVKQSYYEKADRKKRTHRLCTIAGTMESIAPEIKELTLPEVTNLLESIMDLPDVQRVLHNAVLLHREKEEMPIGPVSSECHTN